MNSDAPILPDGRITPATGEEIRWYALWTRSRHEQVVREQLVQKHIESFLPTVTRWSRWKDRKKKIDWPLFPGYCFARFNLRERLLIAAGPWTRTLAAQMGADLPLTVERHYVATIRWSDAREMPAPPGSMVES